MKPQIALAILSFTSSFIASITAVPVLATESQDSSAETLDFSRLTIEADLVDVPVEESGLSGSATAIEAKLKTIKNLKEFEAGKAEANASLRAKLANFQASLSEAERDVVGSLVDSNDSSSLLKAAQRDGSIPDEAVFLKPQQSP